MNKFSTRVLIIILTFVLGISAATAWFYYQEYQKTQIILPNSRWEPLFFNGVKGGRDGINQVTKLAGLTELRKTNLNRGDIEIRVWRGFGLAPLEAVILKRKNGQWSALHIRHYDFEKTELKELNPPKSGWNSFWKKIEEKGILALRDPSEKNCEDSGFDGTTYVVELNQNKIYRTYQMREGGKCEGVRQMEEIGEIIGLEFDSGNEQCKTDEWFACMTFLKTSNQTNR